MKNSSKRTKLNKDQVKDSGLALILILLLIGFFSKNVLFFKIALPVLLLVMVVPIIFYPFAVVWLGFSHFMGTIMSKVILTILYSFIVVPIGIARRIFGKDSLKLKEFKQSRQSILIKRNHLFESEDIKRPY